MNDQTPTAPQTAATFDVLGPLREGTFVLEASAGTGKTWSITSLYVRLVVEDGISAERLLALTFGRAAAGELRTRARARLLEARSVLRDALAGGGPSSAGADLVLRALVTGDRQTTNPLPEPELRLRLDRASTALAHLDGASIATIHGFCLDTVRRSALSLDVPFGSCLVEDDRAAIDEVVDDFASRTFAVSTAKEALALRDVARLRRHELRALARAVLGRPDATVWPPPTPWDPHDRSLTDVIVRFRREWRASGEAAYVEAVTALHRQGVLAGKTFGRTKDGALFSPFLARLAAMNAWLDADGAASERPAPGKGLGRGELRERLAPGNTLPEHPAIDGPSDFLERVVAAQLDAPRAGFLHFAREQLLLRRERARELGHDDVLRKLRDGLRRADEHGVGTPIGDAYDVALLDEFQDTDPVQWAIFRRLFADVPGKRLFLVGDPKQAIYAFRGADVQVYAEACRAVAPERRSTLRESFRSDGALVHALDVAYRDRGAVFEEDVPRYIPMQAARRRHAWSALHGPPGSPAPAALCLRWFDAATWAPGTRDFTIAKGVASERIPGLLASDVARALAGTTWLDHDGEAAPRRLRASDVAVLVRTNAQAAAVQKALRARGLHAVIAATGNVFHGPEAGWLAGYLAALAEPYEATARAFALSPLGGFSVEALHRATTETAAPSEDGALRSSEANRWLALLDSLAEQRRACASRGIGVALQACLERDPALLPRLAGGLDGARALTNLRHLEELLEARELVAGRSIAALARWLEAQRADERAGEGETELRLEADRDAIRVATMHRSKGLEYPVVFLPYAWDGALLRSGDVARVFHERDAQGRPTSVLGVDVRRGEDRPHGQRNEDWAREEARAESLRLFYVAMTRARHQVVAYLGAVTAPGGTGALATSPIGMLLFGGRDPEAAPRTRGAHAATDIAARLASGQRGAFEAVVRDLALVAATSLPPDAPASAVAAIAWSDDPLPPPRDDARHDDRGAARARPPLAVAPFTRGLHVAASTGYLRASYTSLTARSAHAVPTPPLGTAPPGELLALADASKDAAAELPLARFARGAAVGIYVHALLERLDFRSGREREDGRAHAPAPSGRGRATATFAAEEARVYGVSREDAATFAAALPGILETPLGDEAGGIRLADLGPEDRLDELAFDLAVGGGHAAVGAGAGGVSARALGRLLATPRRTSLDASDEGLPWTRAYSEALRAGALAFPDFSGFLTGSLDLVYRVATPHGHRYFVADYKTNWLGAPAADGALRAIAPAYRPEALAGEMVKHHYFVQAHLYLLALHRFLRARLGARYDYDVHVGGAVYLFLRGMTPTLGSRAGVFVERPPRAIIEQLDALFERGATARASP